MSGKETNWRTSNPSRPRPLACKAVLADLLNIAREQNCAVVGVPKKGSDSENAMFALLPSATINPSSKPSESGFISYTFQKDAGNRSRNSDDSFSSCVSSPSNYSEEDSCEDSESCDIVGTLSTEGAFVPSEVSVRIPDVRNDRLQTFECPSFIFDAFSPARSVKGLDIQTKIPLDFGGAEDDTVDHYAIKLPCQEKAILVEPAISRDILSDSLLNYTRKPTDSESFSRSASANEASPRRSEGMNNQPSFVLLPTKNSGPEVLLVSSSFNHSGDLSDLELEESVCEEPCNTTSTSTSSIPIPLRSSVFNLGLNGVFRVPATTVVSVNLMQPSVNYGMLRIVPRLAASELSR